MRRPTFPQLPAQLPGFALLLAIAPLTAACDAGTSAWTPGQSAAPVTPPAEAGYIAPPHVMRVSAGPQGLALVGHGEAGARVRLGPPTGDAIFAVADKTGAWSLTLPPSDAVRLFGLSMAVGDRAVQSEGYLMVSPEGRVVQLRAGGGAWSLAAPTTAPRLLTIDHDAEGGAVISGSGPADGVLTARIDRARVVNGRARGDGHFDLALSEPLSAGTHEIEVTGDGGRDALSVTISRAAPLSAPFRGARTDFGWRVDWMTPAGGVQTTLVYLRPGAGA